MIRLSTDARDAACDAVTIMVDRAGKAGSIAIKDASASEICRVELHYPAFERAVAGTAKAMGTPLVGRGTATAGDGKAPASYDVKDADGRVIWSGKIPEDMSFNAATISAKQIISIGAWTHSAPNKDE